MINKDFIKQINPKQETYNAKYSEGTYNFLKKNQKKDIKIYYNKYSRINGELKEFNPNKIYPTQIYFMYEENGDWFGTTWTRIMRNEYNVADYTHFEKSDFIDITDWFCDEYFKIGRCMFDNHINFLLGQNHNYVTEEERFDMADGIKICKWCGKEI